MRQDALVKSFVVAAAIALLPNGVRAQPAPDGPAAAGPADGGATSPLTPAVWPARLAPAADSNAKGVIRDMPDAIALTGVRPASGVRKPSTQDLADAKALLGDEGAKAAFEGPGAFFFRPVTLDSIDFSKAVMRPAGGPGNGGGSTGPADRKEPGAADPPATPPPAPPVYFVFVSAEAGPAGKPRVQRTWFGLYAPEGGEEHRRGLALVMPGMLNTPEPVINLFVSDLRKQGWFVLRMMCQPSRFTETSVFDIDLTDLPATMGRVADELTDRVAECAYAVEAASEHAASLHPELKGLPRIAVGMSGGAIILPTVVARDPAGYAAAVIIAGGADFFAISDLSNYKYLIDAVDFKWLPGPPTDEQRKAADEVYLKDAPLDAYTTASALKGKPVLMIHGQYDNAVPAATGELLWERLGKPERWVQSAGHEEVFFKIPHEMDKIMGWIGEHTGGATGP